MDVPLNHVEPHAGSIAATARDGGAETMPVAGVRQRFRNLLVHRRTAALRVGVVAAACVAAWFVVQVFGRPYVFFDLRIYHGAVVYWAHGGSLYDYLDPGVSLGFTYPPFAALAMLPMAHLSMLDAAWINVGASLAALALVLAAFIRPIAERCGWRTRWFPIAVAVPAAAALEPIRESLGYGQVNILLFGLIMADLVALRWFSRRRPERPRALDGHRVLAAITDRFLAGQWAGVGIGLATAVKLTPALFIIYLMVSRQWRVARTAIVTTLAVTVIGFVFARQESVAYFTSVVFQTNRVGQADMTPNQSLAGLLARLYDVFSAPTLLWVTFTLVMLVVGLSRAAHAHGEGDELTAFTLVGLTANVVSPISWSHHLVFVIPAIIVLLDAAVRRRAASRGISRRHASFSPNGLVPTRLREPIWFPAMVGFRHAAAGIALYVLFLVSPIWPYEHQLPAVSHYADGLIGVLAENSFAIALIVLVAVLPWRPGAEPVYSAEAVAVPAGRRSPAQPARPVSAAPVPTAPAETRPELAETVDEPARAKADHSG
jgi:alpha-1,2-mannosyltransferase